MINAGRARHPRARRRLDDRHRGPLAVGAVGAHGARHRRRLRGADAVGRARRRRRRFVGRDARVADGYRAATPVAAAVPPARGEPRARALAATSCARGARRCAPRSSRSPDTPRLLREHARARRPRHARRSGASRAHAARAGAGRRRRLRPRRAVPAFRRRRAGPAAARRRDAAGARGHRALHRRAVGHRPRDRRTACARSTNARRDGAPTSRCRPACSSTRFLAGAAALYRAVPQRVRRRRMDAPAFLRGEDARAAAAPLQVPGHALQPRAERQGKPGRPARPADRALDRARRRPRPRAGASSPRTGSSRPARRAQCRGRSG